MSNYQSDAESDARETVSEFKDTILEQLEEKGEASKDLHNDYLNGDAWHHESHVDRQYNLIDAAELIDELSEYEETDSGLWEGQQPKEAIGTCAAYTYGSAVLSEWCDLIDEINREVETIIDDFDEQIEVAEEAEVDEDMDYEGETAEALRTDKKIALEELIDQVTIG